jgi:hypothetical protein
MRRPGLPFRGMRHGKSIENRGSVAAASMRTEMRRFGNIRIGQVLQDAAGFGRLHGTATTAQLFQLSLQCLQLFDAVGNVADVLVQQRIDAGAIFFRPVAEIEQRADFIQRHVERTAMTNELQALDVGVAVQPVITGRTLRLRQQILLFVITDCFH